MVTDVSLDRMSTMISLFKVDLPCTTSLVKATTTTDRVPISIEDSSWVHSLYNVTRIVLVVVGFRFDLMNIGDDANVIFRVLSLVQLPIYLTLSTTVHSVDNFNVDMVIFEVVGVDNVDLIDEVYTIEGFLIVIIVKVFDSDVCNMNVGIGKEVRRKMAGITEEPITIVLIVTVINNVQDFLVISNVV